MELSEMLRNVIQVAPVVGVLAYGWIQERLSRQRWEARYMELSRVYRETLRDQAGLESEATSKNGDLSQSPE